MTPFLRPNHETRVYPGWQSFTGQATSTGTTTTLIDTSLSSTGAYVGETVIVTSGTDNGQTETVSAYNASTHTLTLASAFTSATNSTTHFIVAGTTGPIQVTREYRPASGASSGQRTVYDEVLTTSAAPSLNSSGLPTGLETISSSNIQSLVRDITNSSGQLVEEDNYFSMSGITYAVATPQLGSSSNDSSSGNYHATLYGYDARGRLDRVVAPTGTITRTVYDYLGRTTSLWVGTDDTPTTGDWSPTNNSGANMVDVEDYYYDQRQAGPSTPTLSQTSGGAIPPTTYFVEITYVTPQGESVASGEASYSASDSYLLKVTSPSSAAGVTGYNVYVSDVSGQEVLQNASPIAIGTDWTEPTAGLVTGALLPINNIGDSDLTEAVQHPDTTAADDRVTLNLFDWRDRLIASKAGALLSSGVPDPSGETDGAGRLITYTSYDNLGEPTASRTYAGDGVSLYDFANWSSSTDSSDLRAYSVASYDDQGRVYQTSVYSVDPSAGTVGSSLATNYFYDHRGNLIDESDPGGIATKHEYDGAGRDVKDSTTDGGVINSATQNWANAGTTANDVVIEQTITTYDPAGNVILSEDLQRFDNDSTSSTGDLGSPTAGIGARDYFTAMYYDAANRLTDSVNVGTNGGSTYTRPSTVPADSDTVLVTHTDYDAAGRVLDTVDPRGIATANFYDLMGRTIKTIAAWDGTGSSPTPTSDTNQITTYTYDGDGNELTQVAIMPSGTNSQITAYIYGTTSTSGVYSNDLLAKVEYPSASTGAASSSASDDQSYTYNALGQETSFTDQNGTIHAYAYDVLGRMTADDVTTFGSGVSTQTYGIAYSFDSAGWPFKQTTYSNSGLTTVENEVEDVYNGYGQLIQQYQESSGAVNTSTSASVQYGYSQPSGTNYSRLVSMTYPNGRIEDYGYNSGIDTTISRISTIADDGGAAPSTVASYKYLGLSTIVVENEVQATTELTYIQVSGDTLAGSDGGDQYTGLDRFGRVVDQFYYNWSTTATTDRLQYRYDRDGNVLYEKNLVNGDFSELYHANSAASGDDNSAYDPLNRITSFQRGTLSSSGHNGGSFDTVSTLNSVSGVPNQNNWSLDAIGNQTASFLPGSSESNTVNSQNEETAYNGNTLTYDHNGNMLTDQAGNQYTYDAWNRQVVIKNSGGTTIETYAYDAGGRAVITNIGSTVYSYYSASGQVIQDSFSGTYEQYVWGLAYINDLIMRDRDSDFSSATGDYGKTGSGLDERDFVQHDKQFSVVSFTGNAGLLIERFVYDPYGTVTVLSPSWGVTSDGTNYFFIRYQGMRQDFEVPDQYLSQSRVYNATLGRWTSQDWAGYVDGTDLYQAMDSNTVRFTDPMGTAPNDKWYGYTNKTFQRWFHRFWKSPGDPDATQEDIEGAYEEWDSTGRPDADGHKTVDPNEEPGAGDECPDDADDTGTTERSLNPYDLNDPVLPPYLVAQGHVYRSNPHWSKVDYVNIMDYLNGLQQGLTPEEFNLLDHVDNPNYVPPGQIEPSWWNSGSPLSDPTGPGIPGINPITGIGGSGEPVPSPALGPILAGG